MPSSARLDAPGLVHDVMNRGIERRLKAVDIALALNVKPAAVYASVSDRRGELSSIEIQLTNI